MIWKVALVVFKNKKITVFEQLDIKMIKENCSFFVAKEDRSYFLDGPAASSLLIYAFILCIKCNSSMQILIE